MSIGSNIATYRKSMNLSQEALAQHLNVTNQAVSKWETDQCCPDITLLPDIADLFGITIDELFDHRHVVNQKTTDLPWNDDNILRVVMYIGHTLIANGDPETEHQYKVDSTVDGIISTVSVICDYVDGDVKTQGNARCGTVKGDVDAGGSVSCGSVHGDVNACGSVGCGDVQGDVEAGGTVSASDIKGDVDAGGNVTCTNIGGNANAAMSVIIKK